MVNKLWVLTISALLLIWTLPVVAHSKLASSIPEQNALLSVMPDEFLLIFKKDLRLAKVQLKHENLAPMTFDLSQYKRFSTKFQLESPLETDTPLPSGLYEIEWRGIGEDGHVMKGVFLFRLVH